MGDTILIKFCKLEKIPYTITFNGKKYYFIGMDADIIFELGGDIYSLGKFIKKIGDKEIYYREEFDEIILWFPKEGGGYIYAPRDK